MGLSVSDKILLTKQADKQTVAFSCAIKQYSAFKKQGNGTPAWLSGLLAHVLICFWLTSSSQGPGIESHIGLLAMQGVCRWCLRGIDIQICKTKKFWRSVSQKCEYA